jgi:hypothetical protein
MKHQSENELLSAYLDGELTPAEQAQAEQLLAGSASARRMLDELRSLSSALQSLPQHKLHDDLSEKVLQVAAKRKTADDDVDHSARPAAPGRAFSRPMGRQIAERFKDNPRLVVWPAVILTVAVLLMVFNPDQRGSNRPIALAPNAKNHSSLSDDPNRAVVQTDDHPAIHAPETVADRTGHSHLVPKGNPGDLPKSPVATSLSGLVVIQCQVSRETLAQQDYRKIFDANNVALPDKSAGEMLHATPSELAEVAEIDSTVATDNPSAADASFKARAVAVEVTPVQFAGILNRLQSMPEIFHGVSVKTQPQQPGATTSSTKRLLVVFRVADSN